jgi:hypothetical protein
VLRELDERQVRERELATTLAAEDEVVAGKDVEPGPKALAEGG